MGDSNQAVTVGRLSDVFHGQGPIAVHGEADSSLVAKKAGEDFREVLIRFHRSNFLRVRKPPAMSARGFRLTVRAVNVDGPSPQNQTSSRMSSK